MSEITAIIDERIRNLHHVVTQDDMGTEGLVAIGLGHVRALARFEPLTILVDQTHQGDGNVEQGGRDTGETIEALLRLGVEEAALVERAEAPVFVCR